MINYTIIQLMAGIGIGLISYKLYEMYNENDKRQEA